MIIPWSRKQSWSRLLEADLHNDINLQDLGLPFSKRSDPRLLHPCHSLDSTFLSSLTPWSFLSGALAIIPTDKNAQVLGHFERTTVLNSTNIKKVNKTVEISHPVWRGVVEIICKLESEDLELILVL